MLHGLLQETAQHHLVGVHFLGASAVNAFEQLFDLVLQHVQLTTIDTAIGTGHPRHLEASLLDSLKPYGDPVTVPVEELEHAAAPIAKDKEGFGQRVDPQFGAHDTAQPVKGLSHVAGNPE